MDSQIHEDGKVGSRGVTEDDDGIVWYWEFDGEEVKFEGKKMPNHTSVTAVAYIPTEVRRHANEYIYEILETAEFPEP